jgi:hypothetical protein
MIALIKVHQTALRGAGCASPPPLCGRPGSVAANTADVQCMNWKRDE